MQTARHILSALLVLGLLFSGLPLTGREDANQDKRVDLEDAILCVRDLVRTAEEPGAFLLQAETVITVLHHVAGLKRNIRPVNETKSKPTSLTSNGFYLASSVDTPCDVENPFSISENGFLCESLSLEPPTPPPERPCSCFTASAA